tara:strand:+ start:515 stop:805 length:291 start_codon:yes stop_codon:yes gene_type:complete
MIVNSDINISLKSKSSPEVKITTIDGGTISGAAIIAPTLVLIATGPVGASGAVGDTGDTGSGGGGTSTSVGIGEFEGGNASTLYASTDIILDSLGA